MDYRQIIESKYNRQNWQQLLHDIFGQNATFFTIPQPIQVDASIAQQALYIGNITLKDGNTLAVYEVELADRVQIERNRTGIRNLLCSSWKGIFTGALMFCFIQNESALRFSYVSETYAFADDGSLKKESTDTKRFTYFLGEGHRSRTAIAQFEALSKSGLTLKDLTKAFSVEALSDLFFKEYKKQYEDIIEYVTGKRMVKVGNKWEERTTCPPNVAIMQQFSGFPDVEKAVRDYVKKLMGRLVFIQFLQKKGWMGCPAGADWNSGDKEFVQNLFAHSVHKDDFVDDVLEPLFIDLNTRRTNDLVSSIHVGRNIRVPYLNGGLFEKDAYDKTKFPLPAKFMQSMLDFFASYNFTIDENDPDDAEIGVDPEMLGRIFENLLEDNKDKGAFYTPKEIVQYMCRESLIAYLQTDETDDAVRESIRQFVTTHKANTLYDNLLSSIDQKLKDVKICDPAIGSGAFPMGLLRELYACRKAIEGIDDDKAVSIKSHIIQNNIYGVDIEKGAVDIARLRFWLALIVDEKTPHALPNMDFKIMQGNSLLEQYEGVDLSGISLNEQAQKKAKANKQQTWQQTMVFDEQDALDNIQNAIHKYFETQDHTKKEELRGIVDENVRNYIKNIKGCTPAIEQKLANLPIPNDQFFLWHIYFKEVFDKGGFDIVIGNPPYVDYRKIDLLTKRGLPAFETYRVEATGSLYVYFIEKGITLLKTNGMLIFINPYQYLSANSGKGLRTYIINNAHRINSIIDISNIKVFDSASTYTCINSFSKESGLHDIKVYKPLTLNKLQENVAMVKQSSIKKPSYEIYLSTNSVISKLDTIKTTLKDVCSIFCGLSATGFRKFVSDVPLTQRHAIFVEAKQIQKYTISPNKYIDTNIYSKSVLQKFQNECLLMARMTSHMRVGKSSSGYTAGKVNVLHQFKCPEYFLLGLLNSKLLDYYYCQKCEVLHLNGGALPFDTESVKRIPIPLGALDVQNQIVAIVNRILAAKQQTPQADTSQEEAMIDILVYLLYNLTYDEVKVVDNAFAVPEDVYNQWLSNYQAASTLPTEEAMSVDMD